MFFYRLIVDALSLFGQLFPFFIYLSKILKLKNFLCLFSVLSSPVPFIWFKIRGITQCRFCLGNLTDLNTYLAPSEGLFAVGCVSFSAFTVQRSLHRSKFHKHLHTSLLSRCPNKTSGPTRRRLQNHLQCSHTHTQIWARVFKSIQWFNSSKIARVI